MSLLDELMSLSSAEEFFERLDVPYEQSVVHVARLHILRRMGQYLKAEDFSGMDDEAIRQSCKSCLETAYQDFVVSSPIEQRVFKVHQEAIQPKAEPKKAFVPLSDLGVVNK